jgi:hypothetical protein
MHASVAFRLKLFFLVASLPAYAASESNGAVPSWVTSGLIGGAVALGLAINQSRQTKTLWPQVERALATNSLTLAELERALGMSGIMARGKLVMALNTASAEGKLEIIAAPEGTPQLKKVDFIRYTLRP